MNKEEIEKLLKINETIITTEQCKEHRTSRNDERILLMNNMKIKDYIQELEQKSETLDKVTDKLKEDVREEEGYIKWLDERTKEIVQPKKTITVKSDYARSILKIIEGENHE